MIFKVFIDVSKGWFLKILTLFLVHLYISPKYMVGVSKYVQNCVSDLDARDEISRTFCTNPFFSLRPRGSQNWYVQQKSKSIFFTMPMPIVIVKIIKVSTSRKCLQNFLLGKYRLCFFAISNFNVSLYEQNVKPDQKVECFALNHHKFVNG